MFTPSEFEALALITALFAAHLLVPGPNMLFLATAVSRGGRREAAGFAIGTALGTGLWAGAAAFGALHLLEADRGLVKAGSVVIGLSLLMLAAPHLRAAFSPMGAAMRAGSGAHAGDRPCGIALARGVFVTLANANELVFWGAVMALLASTDPSGVLCATLAITCGLAALVFDLGFVIVVSRSGVMGLLARMRRWLELAMGGIFVLSGSALILSA